MRQLPGILFSGLIMLVVGIIHSPGVLKAIFVQGVHHPGAIIRPSTHGVEVVLPRQTGTTVAHTAEAVEHATAQNSDEVSSTAAKTRMNSTDSMLANASKQLPEGYDAIGRDTLKSATEAVSWKSQIYLVQPRNDTEFVALYKQAPTAQQSKEVHSDEAYISLAERVTSASSKDGATQFRQFLATAEDRLIFVIGHNEEGNFRFLDGSDMPLRSMANSCEQKQKKCVFISCESSKFLDGSSAGISYEITYKEALLITSSVQKQLAKRSKDVSIVDMYSIVPGVLKDVVISTKISTNIVLRGRIVVAGTGVPLIVFYGSEAAGNLEIDTDPRSLRSSVQEAVLLYELNSRSLIKSSERAP